MLQYKDNKNKILRDGKSMEWGDDDNTFILNTFGLPSRAETSTVEHFFKPEDGKLQSIMTQSKDALIGSINKRLKDEDLSELKKIETLLIPKCIPIDCKTHGSKLIRKRGQILIDRGIDIDLDELETEYATYKKK
eukprot:423686_1